MEKKRCRQGVNATTEDCAVKPSSHTQTYCLPTGRPDYGIRRAHRRAKRRSSWNFALGLPSLVLPVCLQHYRRHHQHRSDFYTQLATQTIASSGIYRTYSMHLSGRTRTSPSWPLDMTAAEPSFRHRARAQPNPFHWGTYRRYFLGKYGPRSGRTCWFSFGSAVCW